MKSSRNIFPYLIVGILFFYLFHTAEHYYALSKEAVPFLGFERFDWLLSNMNQYSFISSVRRIGLRSSPIFKATT